MTWLKHEQGRERRLFIFVRADRLAPANSAARAWDPDTGGDETFGSVPLSDDGGASVSHYGANTQVTADMRTQVLDALGNVPFYHVYDTADGWTWETALNDAGLAPAFPQPTPP